jgi:hypothetical protein
MKARTTTLGLIHAINDDRHTLRARTGFVSMPIVFSFLQKNAVPVRSLSLGGSLPVARMRLSIRNNLITLVTELTLGELFALARDQVREVLFQNDVEPTLGNTQSGRSVITVALVDFPQTCARKLDSE